MDEPAAAAGEPVGTKTSKPSRRTQVRRFQRRAKKRTKATTYESSLEGPVKIHGWDSAAAAAGPAAAAPAAAGAIAASAAHERETTGALRAMQAALQDVQTVLSLHEREVESLWQATRKPDIPVAGVTHADMIDIRQLVLNLSERVSAVEARGALSSSAPIAGDAAVVIDEMNSRLNKMQQQAAQDAERYEGQLAVLREALRMSDRNGMSEFKDVEARLATTAAAKLEERARQPQASTWTSASVSYASNRPAAPRCPSTDPPLTKASGVEGADDPVPSYPKDACDVFPSADPQLNKANGVWGALRWCQSTDPVPSYMKDVWRGVPHCPSTDRH